LAAVAAAGAARAEFDPEAWNFVREIEAPKKPKGDHACFAVDEHIWASTPDPTLRDLRIVRDETEEVGYALWTPEETPPRVEQRQATVFNLAKRGREATELTLDLGESPPTTNRVRLRTPDVNFRCAVTIEGSEDGRKWKTLREDGAILDFTGDERARLTTVAFPDARMRYLRVTVWTPAGGEPIDLQGATLFQEFPAEAPALPMLAERGVARRIETADGRDTCHTLELGAPNLPVSKIVFETPQESFVRRVRVEVSDDERSWHAAGAGTIFRIRTERFDEANVEVAFPEQFARFVRVRVANGDDPPLGVTRLAVFGRPRYVFFPFEKGRAYRLFYGNASARPPQYEYARVFAHVDPSSAVGTRLGPPEHNPRFIPTREAPKPHPWIERNQWVLYLALAAAVVGLGLVALRALRRPPESPIRP
jgi:hypothetical protein